jgi:3-oxoacyl-[acyl-carrier protein] reductase
MGEHGMSGRLAGKIAIVTGASSGMGLAMRQRFLAEGARVVAVDRQAPIDGAKGGGDLVLLDQDLKAARAPEEIVARAVAAFGTLDIVVNNAGVGDSHAIHATSDEEWAHVLDVNLTIPFKLVRAALPQLIERRGNVVNIASVAGMQGLRNSSAYSSSKAGLIGLTREAAAAYGQHGVRVNAIAPGVIETGMTRALLAENERWRTNMVGSTVLGRAGRPEEIASAALFLASDDASFVTGHVLVVDGGWGWARKFPERG